MMEVDLLGWMERKGWKPFIAEQVKGMDLYDDRITKKARRGEYIPLKCGRCRKTGYFTKNISCIGARSIFLAPGQQPDCSCDFKHLEVHHASGFFKIKGEDMEGQRNRKFK